MSAHATKNAGSDESLITGPIRTCVGCRVRVLSVDLLRFVARPSGDGIQVVPDPARRLPGRGGWIHRRPECLQNAERRRAFGRALKVSGKFDLAELEIEISSKAVHPADQH